MKASRDSVFGLVALVLRAVITLSMALVLSVLPVAPPRPLPEARP